MAVIRGTTTNNSWFSGIVASATHRAFLWPMSATTYTLLLVDDQSIFLDGIESLLERLPEVSMAINSINV